MFNIKVKVWNKWSQNYWYKYRAQKLIVSNIQSTSVSAPLFKEILNDDSHWICTKVIHNNQDMSEFDRQQIYIIPLLLFQKKM